MTIDDFNSLRADTAVEALLECCHCRRWALTVANDRPFPSGTALLGCTRERWAECGEDELLEAFGGHPQIGDLNALRNRYQTTASAEQGQIAAASDATLERLQALNATYRERFGFIFIVCATGKSASEMLTLLEDRIDNSRTEELVNGAREQQAITELRLRKLLGEELP